MNTPIADKIKANPFVEVEYKEIKDEILRVYGVVLLPLSKTKEPISLELQREIYQKYDLMLNGYEPVSAKWVQAIPAAPINSNDWRNPFYEVNLSPSVPPSPSPKSPKPPPKESNERMVEL